MAHKINTVKAKDMLARYDGKAPYADASNTCRNDGYYGASIVREFGMTLKELRKALQS